MAAALLERESCGREHLLQTCMDMDSLQAPTTYLISSWGSIWKDRLFWSFRTETPEVFIDNSWLFCLVLRDLQLLVISVVKGAKGRILASLAALRWEIVAVKGPSTKRNKVPDWAGSVGGLCKACSALQNSASSLKIPFHHPTPWVDRDGSFYWGCFIIHESLIANGHLFCLCR